MHKCPECGRDCDCGGDFDDTCTHYRSPECTFVGDDEPDPDEAAA